MIISTVTEGEMTKTIELLKKIKVVCGRRDAQDAAKVFFGVQPGDSIMYGVHNKKFVEETFKEFSLLNPSFEIRNVGKSGYRTKGWETAVYFNSRLVSGKLLDDYIDEIKSDTPTTKGSIIQGKFYGFPNCCVEAFASSDVSRIFVITEEMLRKRYEEPELSNPFRNHSEQFNGKYVEHVPCKKYCFETSRLAEKYKPILDFVDVI